LKSFRDRKVSAQEFADFVEELFLNADISDLYTKLLIFLPSKHHSFFSDRIKKFENKFIQAKKRQKMEELNRLEERGDVLYLGEEDVEDVDLTSTQAQSNQDVKCVMCVKKAKSPFKARCEHIGCHECWVTWLSVQNNCPACGIKTNLKQLRKIWFTPSQ
jgi:hypothetical protein